MTFEYIKGGASKRTLIKTGGFSPPRRGHLNGTSCSKSLAFSEARASSQTSQRIYSLAADVVDRINARKISTRFKKTFLSLGEPGDSSSFFIRFIRSCQGGSFLGLIISSLNVPEMNDEISNFKDRI